jgi:hypothetical protein
VKIKFIVPVIALALMVGIVATGQKRRPTPRAKPSATPSPSPTPTPTPAPAPTPAESTLAIEAGLIFKSGDVKPVARATFYLLDADAETILREAAFSHDATGSSMAVIISMILGLDDPKYNAVKATFAKHVVAQQVTDFGGKAKFSSLQPGVRFLFGQYSVGRTSAVWYQTVDLKPGMDLALTLDNDNAVSIR